MDEQKSADQTNSESKPDKLFAGKYRTAEELEQGYVNSTREFQRLRERDRDRDQEMARLRNELASRTPANDPLSEKFEENVGVPMEALDRRIETRIHSIMEQALQPVAQAQRAQQDMSELYPDFDLNQIQRAVSKDAVVSESYNELLTTNPKAAYAMGYQTLRATRRNSNPASAAETVNAGMPVGQSGPGDAAAALSEERYRTLLDNAVATGDYSQFLQERFKGTSLDGLGGGLGW